MRRLIPLLLILLATGASRSIPPTRTSCKPTPPIDLDARIVGDPSGPFDILVQASSPLGAELDVEILLPEGVTSLSGLKRLKGKACDLHLSARTRDRNRREILVRASFTQGNATMTRVVPLVLFDAPPVKRAVRHNGRGEAILEFSP